MIRTNHPLRLRADLPDVLASIDEASTPARAALALGLLLAYKLPITAEIVFTDLCRYEALRLGDPSPEIFEQSVYDMIADLLYEQTREADANAKLEEVDKRNRNSKRSKSDQDKPDAHDDK